MLMIAAPISFSIRTRWLQQKIGMFVTGKVVVKENSSSQIFLSLFSLQEEEHWTCLCKPAVWNPEVLPRKQTRSAQMLRAG